MTWILQSRNSFPSVVRESDVMTKGSVRLVSQTRPAVLTSKSKHSPADTVILVQWDSYWTFDLQNCKIIHLCCFKPWNLWQFVTVGIRKEDIWWSREVTHADGALHHLVWMLQGAQTPQTSAPKFLGSPRYIHWHSAMDHQAFFPTQESLLVYLFQFPQFVCVKWHFRSS